MSQITPPIPPVLMRRIQSARQEAMTGQFVLNMHRGVIKSWSITETGRVDDLPVPPLPEIEPMRQERAS